MSSKFELQTSAELILEKKKLQGNYYSNFNNLEEDDEAVVTVGNESECQEE